ncbi:DNA ligase C2 [Cellulomonas hominis]|uniref:ATP-dependent DNA ligase n=1 Tax=Cellulomonas hominis TaxID=156981 RepID=A0A511FHW1_9CELL|nr:ATP-dependent DNA ligase [Cellulomonas hominis]MBB5474801.1 ATP-dependent DNA ligase [Cellulomonas hominis]NKY06616.1 ATP-dependent DNA ligase [Cellulomonas hominis]GEL48802.1 DNA ligase C2 [Cellulomonas hominis]
MPTSRDPDGRGPIDVALARAVESIAETSALPGGTMWSPKWDGYRLVIDRRGADVVLWSRRGTDLTAPFPEIAEAARQQVPVGTVLDGETVVWSGDRLNFSALQRRVASPRTAARLAREQPASMAVFDVLEHDGTDMRRQPLRHRQRVLETLARTWSPPLNLSPTTTDIDVAAAWFRDMVAAGIEGLVAKGAGQPYRPGRRDWLKVKHRSTVDVVCAAVIGPIGRPTVVVAGLPIGGELRIVGRTVPLTALASRTLGRQIQAAGEAHPWPPVVTSATVNGFGGSRDPVTLTRIEPIVVEVSADVAWSGQSFRHPLRLVRVRPELHPDEVSPPSTTA